MFTNHYSLEQFLEESEQKYGYNGHIEEIRENEFPSLKGLSSDYIDLMDYTSHVNSVSSSSPKDQIYLDHAGTTLYSVSHLNAQFRDLSTNVYGNPHSKSPSSLRTSNRIASVRARILDLFNASPKNYDVVFTANATAAIKLVAECFPWEIGSEFLCLREAHTSLVGVREVVQSVKGTYVRMVTEDDVECMLHCINDKILVEAPHSLFAYPAQCNFSGTRYPLSWVLRARQHLPHHSILLDAASYLTTGSLSLSDVYTAPDFVVLSFYKLFGLPTGLGALILKNSSAQLLRKRYFGGGTVAAVAYDEPWRVDRGLPHERLEDGTVNFLDIISLDHGISEWLRIFGSFTSISSHVHTLTKCLYRKMVELKHWNGRPVCVIYIGDEAKTVNWERQGPVLNFNLIRPDGTWIGYGEVDKVAGLAGVHLRTGGFCNPGSTQRWLNLSTEVVKANLKAGHVCWDDKDLINGRVIGSIRVSLGAMSNITDVLKFLEFLSSYFVESVPPPQFSHLDSTSTQGIDGKASGEIILSQLVIYPIKSCHGCSIPITTSWPITTYGFLYDREWMLVNDATGVALNQKRVPRMSLISPIIDLKRNLMTISAPFQDSLEISLDNQSNQLSSCDDSSVCDDMILTHRYNDPVISAWFTKALGGDIKVHLSRHPFGSSVRFVKPHLHNERTNSSSLSPLPISLTNESPFLLISSTSVANLVTRIRDRTVTDPTLPHEADFVESSCFRGNLILTGEGLRPYAEDRWKSVQIGNQVFAVLGGCRRCHMVCIHQDTGKRTREPFLTLALERKLKGQVLFGVHMVHVAEMSKMPFEVRPGERVVVIEE